MIAQTLPPNVQLYLQRVDELYLLVRRLMAEIEPNATFVEGDPVVIRFAGQEPYEAPTLVIRRAPETDIRLVPRGHETVVAEGCVDMESSYGSESLLYLPAGGTIYDPDPAEGWSWCDDDIKAGMPRLSKDVLSWLLGRLS